MKDLTIRDKIAIEAMNGIVINEYATRFAASQAGPGNDLPTSVAKYAYAIADAMLKEREKKEGSKPQ